MSFLFDPAAVTFYTSVETRYFKIKGKKDMFKNNLGDMITEITHKVLEINV